MEKVQAEKENQCMIVQAPIDCKVRVILRREKSFYGPGVEELLIYVRRCGSLRKAAEMAGIPYSKAWKIIRDAERGFGFPLLYCEQGGADGGGSRLSPEAIEVMEGYGRIVKAVTESLNESFPEYRELVGRLRRERGG